MACLCQISGNRILPFTGANEAKINSMREYAIECAVLKVIGSEAVCNTADEAIQMFGGMGYSQETGVEMAYRDARITKIYLADRKMELTPVFRRLILTQPGIVSAGFAFRPSSSIAIQKSQT